LAFLVSALMLILTIDGKLNDIWRVRTTRHLARRIIVYWTLLTLGPLLLAMSLSISSYVMSASKGWVSVLPDSLSAFLNVVEFTVLACSMAAMYRFVPNTQVRWTHALLGGTFVALGIELAKSGLAWYLAKVPTFSAVYGAFATVPILLIWIYVAWVIVLLGAVVAAYSPSLRSGIARRGDTPGWNYQLALEILQALAKKGSGQNLDALSKELRVDDLQLESPLQTLMSLDWIGKLDETHQVQSAQGQGGRYVLLVDPAKTLLAPLSDRLLLPNQASTQKLWQKGQMSVIYMSEVL
jgi:membrane protein